MGMNPDQSPLDIIYDAATNHIEDLVLIAPGHVFLNLLKAVGYLAGIISIMGIIIMLYFTRHPQRSAELKEAFVHKLFLVFLLSSIVFIFNLMFSVFNGIFMG